MTIPQSITREQTLEALKVMGIDPHDVKSLWMNIHQIRITTPHHKLEGNVTESREITIPVTGEF